MVVLSVKVLLFLVLFFLFWSIICILHLLNLNDDVDDDANEVGIGLVLLVFVILCDF